MRCALLGLLAFVVATDVVAQEAASKDDEKPVVIYGIYPKEGQCTEANASAVAFEDLLREKAKYRNTCISTIAWIFDRSLFLTSDDARSNLSSVNARVAERRAGLYARDAVWAQISASEMSRARVIGMLWDCEMFSGPNVMMVMGYCHYTGGPFIGVASVSPVR